MAHGRGDQTSAPRLLCLRGKVREKTFTTVMLLYKVENALIGSRKQIFITIFQVLRKRLGSSKERVEDRDFQAHGDGRHRGK